jgi:hypothetical protein
MCDWRCAARGWLAEHVRRAETRAGESFARVKCGPMCHIPKFPVVSMQARTRGAFANIQVNTTPTWQSTSEAGWTAVRLGVDYKF